MKRVIYVEDTLNRNKYVFYKDFENFGIYQKMTPNGYFVHQDWLITNGEITIVCQSYNHYCEEELFDIIDYYNENGEFGIKAIKRENNLYIMHQSGQKI